MTDTLSITLAQLNQTVGDIAGNAQAMLAVRERARGRTWWSIPKCS